ncbi:hypothetical protein ACWDR3_06685 [Streptomyces sp. NPDC001002]
MQRTLQVGHARRSFGAPVLAPVKATGDRGFNPRARRRQPARRRGLNVAQLVDAHPGSVEPVGQLSGDDAQQAMLGIVVQVANADRVVLDRSGVDRHGPPPAVICVTLCIT